MRAADLLDGLEDVLALGQALDRLGQREQQVLGGDVVVLQPPGLALGAAQDVEQLARGGRLACAGGDGGQAVKRAADLAADGDRIGADLAQDGIDDPLLLVEQSEQQVLRRRFRVAAVGGKPDRLLDGLL
jgi:hypothetical protein